MQFSPSPSPRLLVLIAAIVSTVSGTILAAAEWPPSMFS